MDRDTNGFVVQLPATCHHRGGKQRVRVFFAYVVTDPYALRMSVSTGRGTLSVRWDFARELLADGLNQPTGTGDVVIAPERRGMVGITLSSPTGNARLRFHRARLEYALELTEQLVPLGTEAEHIDWDQAIAGLIEGGGR